MAKYVEPVVSTSYNLVMQPLILVVASSPGSLHVSHWLQRARRPGNEARSVVHIEQIKTLQNASEVHLDSLVERTWHQCRQHCLVSLLCTHSASCLQETQGL